MFSIIYLNTKITFPRHHYIIIFPKMFFSPIQYLSTLIIKKAVVKLGMSSLATNTIVNLFHSSMQSVRTVGFLPTIRVLRELRVLVKRGGTNPAQATVEQVNIRNLLNAGAVQTIFNNCLPDISTLLKTNHLGFSFLYDLFFVGFCMNLIKPILFKLLKMILGLILSSIGILFNEVLSSIPLLKDAAYYVINLLESHTTFRIPTFSKVSNISSTESGESFPDESLIFEEEEGWTKTGIALYSLGFIVAGAVSIVAWLVVIDHFNHELVANTLLAKEIVESTYSLWDSLLTLFNSKPDLPPTSPTDSVDIGDGQIRQIKFRTHSASTDAPEAISRTSSTGSTSSSGSSTIRGSN